MAENKRVWFITGASSGFGLELARAALSAGESVVAAARRAAGLRPPVPGSEERFFPLTLDVSKTDEAGPAIRKALERFGRIDVLVNNAGHTQVGAVEETTEEELRALFDLHVFGPFALTRAVLPHMRERRSGWIVQMSSMGGQITWAGFGPYCATKFALEGLSETLASEVAPFGIRVLIVEPGVFRTSIFDTKVAFESKTMPEYAETVGKSREYVHDNAGQQPGDPAKAAAAIRTAIDSPRPPLRLPLGADALEAIRGHLKTVGEELQQWERVITDTQF
ncbi:MAG: SDR family NAD(P)-dependent oxidoreductase [Myxococcaceae bacterium]|nr:MAG: SDR family NAD(P)-dependent oxidoreductase [Myxococcaceae bacterium]